MSEPTNVMVDAQYGIAQVLKPFEGFEQVYQGISGTRPIAFPGTLDQDAQDQRTGFDPNLISGVPLALGSRLELWIPQTIAGYTPTSNYQYRLLWRMRNAGDYRNQFQRAGGPRNIGYHLPGQNLGEPQVVTGTFSPVNQRFFIPGAQHVVAYEQAEPGAGSGTTNLRPEVLRPIISPSWFQPLTPAGNLAVWQQGTYQFSSSASPGGPSWSPFWIDAEGDELCILAEKVDPTNPWDFAGEDLAFSNTYGNNNGANPRDPFVGILYLMGSGSP